MSFGIARNEKPSWGLVSLIAVTAALAAVVAMAFAVQPATAFAAGDAAEDPAATATADAAATVCADAAPVKSGLATQSYTPTWIDDVANPGENPYVPSAPFINLKVGDPETIKVNDSNSHVCWCTFTPTEGGDYAFTSRSSEDAYGALYVGHDHAGYYNPDIDGSKPGYLRIAYDDYRGGDCDFKVKGRNLRAGWTYYLACSNADDDDDAYDVMVTKLDDYDLTQARFYFDNTLWTGTTASLEALYVRVENSTYSEDRRQEVWHDFEVGKEYQVEGWYSYDDVAGTETKLDAAPSQVGQYFVRLEGIAPYHGAKNIDFDIYDPFDLENWGFECKDIYAGTKASISTLGMYFELNVPGSFDREPKPGTDCVINCWYKLVKKAGEWTRKPLKSAPSMPGKYYVELKGEGDFHGITGAGFTISPPKKGSGLNKGANRFQVTSPGKELAFAGSKAKKVKVPATVKIGGVTYKVTSIAAGAFKNNKKLKSLVIGSNVKNVGKNALKGTKLKTIVVKSGKLTKKAAKNLVKGSKVRTVKLKGKAAKSKAAKYQNHFGKKIAVR